MVPAKLIQHVVFQADSIEQILLNLVVSSFVEMKQLWGSNFKVTRDLRWQVCDKPQSSYFKRLKYNTAQTLARGRFLFLPNWNWLLITGPLTHRSIDQEKSGCWAT